MMFVLNILSPRSLILDIRTKLAAHKMLASGVPGAHTIAIEPIPATFEVPLTIMDLFLEV